MLRDEFLRQEVASATSYRRAAGFFDSSVFAAAPDEFVGFFERGGAMELVCSPILGEHDIETCVDALSRPNVWLSRRLPLPDKVRQRPTELLGWALCRGQLHVQIAILRNQLRHAIYHEKLGLFGLPGQEVVGFFGSANETASGYVHNFEAIQVFRQDGSEDERRTLRHMQDDFERLWSNNTAGLEVVPLHEALARQMLEVRAGDTERRGSPGRTAPSSSVERRWGEVLAMPSRLTLRPHQADAIDRWFEAGGQGIYAMATGSGKTIAALATATRVFQKTGGPLVVVVVAPFLSLIDQWIGTMKWFGLRPVRCADTSATWLPKAQNALYLANNGRRQVLSLVVTNRAFMGAPFQELLQRLEVRTLLVADEVHNLGATGLRKALPEHVSLRLGLSATPDRKWDDAGTRALQDYFGKPVIHFGLREALESDPPVLCPYAYHPVLVELEPDELEEYVRLTRSIGRLMGGEGDVEKSEMAFRLLIRRARLIASARNKLVALGRIMAGMAGSHFNLVYCGDARTEYAGADEMPAQDGVTVDPLPRQVDAAVHLLGRELKMHVARYTSDESDDDNRSALQAFREGRLQALVAIRCLDEGVDIPNVRRAFILASSTNPRQFIQRRGRVLRLAEGKEKAEIYDFFVVPPGEEETDPEVFKTERKLVQREMERAVDFIELATNSVDARFELLPMLKKMQLLDMLAPRQTADEGTR